MDDDVVLNIGEVDVKLSMSGSSSAKSRKQQTRKGRHHNSPNWSQVCTDFSKLLGLNQILNFGFTVGGVLVLWETGLALVLLILYAVALAEMRYWDRHCALCVGITVNSISLLVFFIASTFAVLDLGSKFPREDIVKGLKFVTHAAILLLQFSSLIVELVELVGSGNQIITIFFICVQCLVVFGNICMSKSEYAIASQKRLLAPSGKRRRLKRKGERKHYKRLHHSSIY